jgi:type II secretory pathway pseudopilin PulG
MVEQKRKLPKWLIVLIGVIVAIVVVAFTGILISITIPSWRKSVRAGNEAATVNNMRTIINDEQIYYLEHRSYGTLEQLIAGGMLDSRFNSNPPIVNGYVFTLKVAPSTRDQTTSFTLSADPQIEYGFNATGTNHFYVDSTDSLIHVNDAQPATAADPQIR